MKTKLPLILLFASLLSFGQATLIEDLNLGTFSSSPRNKIEFKGNVYFTADDGIHGIELWRTDGTEVGTELFKDFVVGEENGFSVYDFYTDANFLYFIAKDGVNNYLWKTDGTSAGTEKIKQFSSIQFHTDLNGELIFSANNQLWKSDGTEAGTIVLATYPVFGNRFVKSSNVMYFSAESSSSIGKELYKTDGTSTGTELVKDIRPGSSDSFPNQFAEVNGSIYFSANDGSNGTELWTTDGTSAGTVLVADITSGSNSSFTSSTKYAIVNNQLIFNIGNKLWRSDGTQAGTIELKDLETSVKHITTFNNKAYVFNFNSSFWESDGTEAGTVKIDVPEVKEFFHNNQFAVVGNEFYFQARNTFEGYELWKTDGTASGTFMVKDVHPAFDDNNIEDIIALNGKAIFTGNDWNLYGRELWISDGTEAGTTMLKDINEQGTNNSSPEEFIEFNNEVYFSADNGTNGRELFKTDGNSISLVKDINPGNLYSSPSELTEFNGEIFFFAYTNTSGKELWKTDGTESGTVLVKDINPGTSSGISQGNIAIFNNKMYFFANDGVVGGELWESDGTEAGTVLVKDINVGDADSNSFRTAIIIVYDNHMYFTAHAGDSDYELWKSDGTDSGTALFYDAHSGGSGSADSFIIFNNELYFRSNSGIGNELFKTNGTTSSIVRDIRPGSSGSFPNELTVAGNNLFFRANNGSTGNELWKTDGTSTVEVKNIRSGSSSSSPQRLTALNNELYFIANNGSNGNELWKSDGTSGGTVMVKDINSGSSSSAIQEMFSYGGKLLFGAAEDGLSNNRELWISDGTSNGTILFQDINPDTSQANNGSVPNTFFATDSKLYFAATTATTGYELYSMNQEVLSTDTFTINNSFAINAYPNPTRYNLTVTVNNEQPNKLQLYNLLGREIINLNNTSLISMQNLPQGIYIVKATYGTKTYSRKVIKQ